MLNRKALNSLKKWKNTKKDECLLVKGARQVGKTFIIDKFGRENYQLFVYINFLEKPELKAIFEGSLEANDIYKKITLFMPNTKLGPGETLVFIDEIQECPNARAALKFLALDNRYDVIASGSLLGISYKEVPSIPVGYEKQLEMHSLDFEEFLWAMGHDEQAINYLKEYFDSLEKIPDSIHERMIRLLREYIVIGGMPAVINRFLETNNYNDVQNEQEKILNSYLDDISKYASMTEKPKAKNCFLSIPKQLAKEYKKFQFSIVEKNATARKYTNSLEWLRDANLVRFCNNVSTPSFPLKAYEREDQYKIYLNDIGLLVSMYGFEIKKEIVENTLKGPAKGGIYENLIADILIKKDKPLNYFKTENSSQEIEFLINGEGFVIPIEVKSGKGASISLDNLLRHPDIKTGYKLTSGNIGKSDKKITMPLYMAMFL